ncbi:ComEC/Rec2 family competence protein [Streptomyces sp. B6B3]|uniref:ComEC/Rec2 family competence protein n=1 Tax=Streptomyces sp. B6B3 TaxID=3153570 RepID=UPI00325C3A52
MSRHEGERHPVHAASGHRLGAANPRAHGPSDLRLLPPAAATWAATAWAVAAPTGQAVAAATACALAAVALALWSRHRSLPASTVSPDPLDLPDKPEEFVSAGHPRAPAADPPPSRPPALPAHGAASLARARHRRASLAVALAAVLAGAGAGIAGAGLHAAAAHAGPLPEAAGTTVTAEVTLTADPRLAPPRAGRPDAPRPVLLTAEATEVGTDRGAESVRTPVLLVVEADQTDDWQRLLPRTELRVRARVAEPMPGRLAVEVAAVLRVIDAGPPPVVADPGTAQRVAGQLRDGLRAAVAGLPEEPRGLLPALVVGDDSAVPPGLAEAVEASGMTHLIVVSGAQVTLILAVLIGPAAVASRVERRGLAARLGVPLRVTAALGGALLLGFVLVARPEPSVLRAAVCGGVVLLAIGTGRRRALLPALATAALLLVLWQPALARSFGFLLSVLATGALLVLAPRWSRALRRRRVPGWLAECLAVAAAAHVVCAPVVAVFTAATSLVAIPCNLLAGPAVPPAVVLGWLALACAPFAPPLAAACAWLASWPTRWVVAVAHAGADLPGAELGWPGGWWGAALLTAVTVATLPLARHALHHRWPAALCVLVLLLAVVRPAPLPRLLTGWPPPDWLLVACDVGQGDALVLSAGGHSALVIDTGPDPAAIDICLRDLAVTHIPLLILTHFHADHVSGLPGALNGRRVEAIQTSTVRDSPEQAAFVERIASEAEVPVLPATPGVRHSLGDTLSWQVLWPPTNAEALGFEANDASVTLLLTAGEITVFLPGDLEPEAQRRLLAAYPTLPEVDVLKVAHHGSAAQHPPLLDQLSPRLAVVSAGADNDYGHPAPTTLAALDQAGATTVRTDLHGTLAITHTPAGPTAVLRRHRSRTGRDSPRARRPQRRGVVGVGGFDHERHGGHPRGRCPSRRRSGTGKPACLENVARGLLPIVPLLLLDLDNTLVDRDAAFRGAVAAFLVEHRLPTTDLSWVMAVDASGYAARHDVAAAMADRYGDRVPATAIRALLEHGAADRVVLAASSREALVKARADGWSCVIVTNGSTVQQEAKIRHTGLHRLVQGWVISEGVGHKKPRPEIFHAAADAAGVPLTGAWVVGDSPQADIAGADTLGLRSVWVSNGQPWPLSSFRPTHVAEDTATAIDIVIGTSG